jgi:hypothetical protein
LQTTDKAVRVHQERALFEKPSARAAKEWADVDNMENSGQYSFFSAVVSK